MSSVIDQNTSGSAGTGGLGPTVGSAAIYQAFTGNGLTLDYAIGKYNQDSGFPVNDGTITAYIYAHTGTFGTNSNKTGSALAASAAINCSSLSYDVDTQFTFSGANRIVLTNATKYIVWFAVAGVSSGYLGVYASYGGVHAGNGGYDYGFDAALDIVFGVYGSAATTYTPPPRNYQPFLAQ